MPEIDRIDIDTKVEAAKTQCLEVKNAIKRRFELAANFLQILQQAEALSNNFIHVEIMLSNSPDDLAQFKIHWDQIKPAYTELKKDGNHFLADATKVNTSLVFTIDKYNSLSN